MAKPCGRGYSHTAQRPIHNPVPYMAADAATLQPALHYTVNRSPAALTRVGIRLDFTVLIIIISHRKVYVVNKSIRIVVHIA